MSYGLRPYRLLRTGRCYERCRKHGRKVLQSRVTELRPKGNIRPTRPRAAGTHEREPNPVSLSAVRSRIWKMSAVLNVSHCFLMLYEARRLTLVVVGLLATWNSPRVLAQLFALW